MCSFPDFDFINWKFDLSAHLKDQLCLIMDSAILPAKLDGQNSHGHISDMEALVGCVRG